MADQIRIRELTETTVIDDAAFLAVDYENETHKVSVENFNANANATAKRYAEQAAASATAAAGSATAASATSAEVDLKVTDAQGYATSAANSATNSRTYANSSQEYANAAAASANLADADADASAASAAAAAESSVLSRSWAVGGTGTRTGEDTNNARYWSDVAAAAAGGGVTSFNGRGGAVTPQAGDYTASMVGAAAASDVYTKSETYAKNEVYNTSQTYPRTTIDTMVAGAAAAGVTSFNNRTGAVVPSGSDYTAAIINGTDTNGVLGVGGRVYTIQALIDEITNRILNSLVTDSDLATALQSYVTKSMITTLATITNTKTNVLDGTEKNPSVSGSLAAQIKAITDDYLKSSNIYNGLDKTAAGFALDARQGKALNDSLANLSTDVSTNYATKAELANTDASIANLKNGTEKFSHISMTPISTPSIDSSIANMFASSAGNITAYSAAYGNNVLIQSQVYITDKYGSLSSRYRTRASESDEWGSWSSYGYFYPMRHKDISGTTDANGFVSLDLDPDTTLPILGSTRKGGGSLSDRYVEFTPGASSWYGRVTYRGSAVASTEIKFRVWYFDAEQTLV